MSSRHHQVDDACLLEAFNSTFAVMGHARDEDQISLVDIHGKVGEMHSLL